MLPQIQNKRMNFNIQSWFKDNLIFWIKQLNLSAKSKILEKILKKDTECERLLLYSEIRAKLLN
jgi:hypothetical protein